ncbi:MarR family winged helix-turn-helix transcriptional regulator [Nocardia brasiliensis]|uniref:MarR family winged helix-turn-helix transcriptional regulator n=1 Tax=Nocardia brasiliensis TaxID=37326 RepID=UPI00190F3BF7|nr:MarR family transcriptional regulator [Nocardia brasiliensis]
MGIASLTLELGGQCIVKSLHDVPGERETASAATDRLFELTEVLGAMMERGMAERGLTQARSRVLWTLHHRGPLTQRALADLLAVTPRNVTGLLDGLAAEDYITREPHPTDRRATLVNLTRRGKSFTATLRRERDEMAAALFDGVPTEQLRSFLDTLEVVIARLKPGEAGLLPSC